MHPAKTGRIDNKNWSFTKKRVDPSWYRKQQQLELNKQKEYGLAYDLNMNLDMEKKWKEHMEVVQSQKLPRNHHQGF